jgi:hypothetical protein
MSFHTPALGFGSRPFWSTKMIDQMMHDYADQYLANLGSYGLTSPTGT